MAATVEVVIEGRDNFSGTLGNFGSIITGIESAVRLAGDAFRAFSGLAMEGLDAIASYERMGASLQSLVASQLLMNDAAVDMASAMDVAGVEAESLLGWIQEIAIKSPFTQEGVAQAFRMAMAYGFTTEEAKRLTQAMIDFAAGTGASEDSMRRIALALGQISATGRVTGGDMLQLVNAGLPVAQILADAFGVTTAEIMAMREKGLLPAKEAIEAITTYLETNFAGAAEAQSLTWAGLLGTFADLKAMGLREFFGGLFDALQPLAVVFAEWLQVEGMDRLAEWGDRLGEIATNVINLGLAIQDAGINSTEVQDILTHMFGDGAAGIIANILSISENIADLGGALFDAGLNSSEFRDVWDSIFGEVDAQVISDWLDDLDAQLADAIANIDWQALGDRFGVFIGELFSGAGSWILPTEALSAIGNAISDFMIGAMGYISWNQLGQALSDSLTNYFLNFFRVEGITDAWEEIGFDITEGLARGITFENMRDNISTFVSNVVNYFKQLLGIASPSTVFFGIGRDIIAGLMGGFAAMISPLIALIDNVVSAILAPFAPIFDLLGIDIGGTGSLGSHTTGTTTGGTGTTTGSTTGSGTVVNQYFSGATINVGSWDEIAYDCIYPNPFVAATSGQLGGSGGGTGAPR